MNERNIGKWLRIMCAALAVLGLAAAYLIPVSMIFYSGNIAPAALTVCAELAIVCCYFALWYFYRVCLLIEQNRSFSAETAGRMRSVSRWLAAACALCLLLLVLHCIGSGMYEFFLFLLFVLFFAFASFAANVLAVLITRAAAIQDENDLTI